VALIEKTRKTVILLGIFLIARSGLVRKAGQPFPKSSKKPLTDSSGYDLLSSGYEVGNVTGQVEIVLYSPGKFPATA
jgi:hypothetical protein